MLLKLISLTDFWNGPTEDAVFGLGVECNFIQMMKYETNDDEIDQCKQSCDTTIGCNAINYMREGRCQLLRCPTPVPYPRLHSKGTKSYYRKKGILKDK